MADVKENAMQGGVPVRLRGLKADGGSISPTMEEVTANLPVATNEKNGLLPASKVRYLKKDGVFYENQGSCIKLYTLKGTSTLSAYITCGRIEGEKLSTFLLNASMAANGLMICNIKNIYNSLSTCKFYYHKNNNTVEIFIITTRTYATIGVLPIIERGGVLYYEVIESLPVDAVEITLE